MAKTKGKKTEEKSLLGTKEDLATEGAIALSKIELKSLVWYVRFTIDTMLPESFRNYKVTLFLNEKPDLDRIEAIKRELNDGLFKDDPRSAENAKKQIAGIEKELNKKRDACETIEFTASVHELKYTDDGTQFVLSFPDKTLDALNRQKGMLGKHYKVRLEPLFL